MNNREQLVEYVKALGQEVIDRAEDLVGDGGMITDMDIWLRIRPDEYPTVEVTRSHASRRVFDIMNDISR